MVRNSTHRTIIYRYMSITLVDMFPCFNAHISPQISRPHSGIFEISRERKSKIIMSQFQNNEQNENKKFKMKEYSLVTKITVKFDKKKIDVFASPVGRNEYVCYNNSSMACLYLVW